MLARERDGIVSQVLWARLRALMNEAGATLKRTAFSFPTRESNDFATVLMDMHGDAIAQSDQSIPSFLATLPLTTQAMLERRPCGAWREGDVMLTNDPWLGAGHLPDVSIVQPIFWRWPSGRLCWQHHPRLRHRRNAVRWVHSRNIRGGSSFSADADPNCRWYERDVF